MKTAKGKDNGCGTRRWAGNFRPAPTVGVGGESDPIKTMRHWLGRVFVGGQATHGLPLQRCSYAIIWMMGVYGGGGRGNLRENREDPAPTVGVACRIASKYRPFLPRRHAHIMHPACLPPMGTLRFLSRHVGKGGYSLRSAPPLPRHNGQSRQKWDSLLQTHINAALLRSSKNLIP